MSYVSCPLRAKAPLIPRVSAGELHWYDRDMSDGSRSSRPVQPMPDDVRSELHDRGLMERYQQRPFYQRNDYLAWIRRAKRPATREKRIQQMLSELELGGVYMGMDHASSRDPS